MELQQIIESEQRCTDMFKKRAEETRKYDGMAAQFVAAHAVEQLELIDRYIVKAREDKAALIAVVSASGTNTLKLCHEIDRDILRMKEARKPHEQLIDDWKTRVLFQMDMPAYVRAQKNGPRPFKFLISLV